jgi:pilus assembly protein CpaD
MNTRLPLVAIGLSVLGACAGVPKPDVANPLSSAADRHQPTAEAAIQRLEIQVEPGESSLDAGERARLHAFASDYLRYGHGALVLETPSGGENADAASAVAADTRRALMDAGVSHAAIAGSTRTESGAAPILVSFDRFEARAPECTPLWRQDLGHQSNNQAWDSFGCATNANLAALVEDPADLLGPRAEAARDSGRRDVVMDAYRQGDPTHAERSQDERATISNAVQ